MGDGTSGIGAIAFLGMIGGVGIAVVFLVISRLLNALGTLKMDWGLTLMIFILLLIVLIFAVPNIMIGLM